MHALFVDRIDAGRRLAAALRQYRNQPDVLVLGLARGGVPVAASLAATLHLPADALVVRKLGVPGHAETAFGALAHYRGATFRSLDVQFHDRLMAAGYDPAELDAVEEHERKELLRRELLYHPPAPEEAVAFSAGTSPQDGGGDDGDTNNGASRDSGNDHGEVGNDGGGNHYGGVPFDWGAPGANGLENLTIIVTDDGLATGSTLLAAVAALRAGSPAAVVVAVPVGSIEGCTAVRRAVDSLICLHVPGKFRAVGAAYRDFRQLTDAEVLDILSGIRPPVQGGPAVRTR
jgi:putative phosphoribosyl transferase